MFFPEGTVRVQLYGRPVDMRKSLNGLHAFARHGVGQDPLSGLPARSAAERHLEPDSAWRINRSLASIPCVASRRGHLLPPP